MVGWWACVWAGFELATGCAKTGGVGLGTAGAVGVDGWMDGLGLRRGWDGGVS